MRKTKNFFKKWIFLQKNLENLEKNSKKWNYSFIGEKLNK